MHLKIITHENIIFDEDVDEIYSKSLDGEFGILKGHEPIMSALDIGVTKVIQNNDVKLFTTMGGIFQFKDDEAVILTDAGEAGDDIDVARAKEAKARAEARLAEVSAAIDAKRAEAALTRAMVRLKAALKKQ
ncbi:ATP synthase F1 subunit epsilon [bacterium]|nr:ATP synthase F1 subunit epsilon [bacterium]